MLGVKYYVDGQLIRGRDGKIYLIENGGLTVIRTLAQLKKFPGQKIYDVPDEVIRQYLDFADGSLVRGPDLKIYLVSGQRLESIKSSPELKRYVGRQIYNVSAEILAKFKKTPPTPGVKYYADGQLIRGRDGKIYLIDKGKLIVVRTLGQLKKYPSRPIYDVADLVIRHFFEFAEGSLLRGPAKKIYVLEKGKLRPVLTLAELKSNHLAKEIFDVAEETLAKFPR